MTYTPHVGWGSMMLVPLLLNYLICWYVWATTDKRKTITWVAALLSFYPQYVACKIIWHIWTEPRRGLEKKRKLERDLIQMEIFFEAVPSTLIMTYLMARASRGKPGDEIIWNSWNRDSTDSVLFFVAFSTSVITSSLGLANNLKVGPCRIVPEPKKHLVSPQFVLIFFACGFTLVGKGVAIATVDNQAERAAVLLITLFLPGFLVGLFACRHKAIMKTFLAQPSVFLLPVFTHFTFSAKSNEHEEIESRKKECFISFSPVYTAVNAGAGVLAFLSLVLIEPHISPPSASDSLLYEKPFYVSFGGLPISVLGLLLTLLVAFSNQCRCFKSWCCSCFLEPFQFGALLTSSPHTPCILGPEGQLTTEEQERASKMGESAHNIGFFQSYSNISSVNSIILLN